MMMMMMLVKPVNEADIDFNKINPKDSSSACIMSKNIINFKNINHFNDMRRV